MPALADHLAQQDPAWLEELLELRPDAVLPTAPQSLAELAEHLESPSSVSLALTTAPLPVLEVLGALLALGGSPTEEALRRMLGQPPRAHEEAPSDDPLDEQLRWLEDRALVRRERDLLVAATGTRAVMPSPLGLGAPLAAQLPRLGTARLQAIVREHGERPPSQKGRALERAHALLSDGDHVRAVVAGAPPSFRGLLERQLADGGADDEDLPDLVADPTAYRRLQEALSWARERGLVLEADSWGYAVSAPAEVVLAVRGPAWTAPFTPSPPPVAGSPVDPAAAERACAAAVTSAAALVTAVADLVRHDGVPLLRAGGVGARELTRLSRRLGAPEPEVRLALEMLEAADLVQQTGEALRSSSAMPAWRESEPAAQLVAALLAWWETPVVSTFVRREGKAVPALAGPQPDQTHGAVLRRALLSTLTRASQGTGLTAAGATALVHWYLPALLDDEDDDALAATWDEAELLGLTALRAVTPLGLALVAEDHEALLEVAAQALPGTQDRAVIGTDLTAVVPGSPSARVTTLLDSCADREGRGGAVVWRLSPGSVRRALDAGTTGAELVQQLADVAGGALPQPLEYLVADVARRHGSLQVRPAVCVVRGDDEALLAQAAADRSLRSLGLLHVAPTVLTSARDATTTLRALRGAGYLPVLQDADGVVQVPSRPGAAPAERPASRPTAATTAAPADVPGTGDLVARLLRSYPSATGPAPDLPVPLELPTPPEPPAPAPDDERHKMLRHLAPRLEERERRVLLAAVDQGDDVLLDYRSSNGRPTQQGVSDLRLSGRTLTGWSDRSGDEQWFAVERILAVEALPPG